MPNALPDATLTIYLDLKVHGGDHILWLVLQKTASTYLICLALLTGTLFCCLRSKLNVQLYFLWIKRNIHQEDKILLLYISFEAP